MPYHLFAKAHLLALSFVDVARRERGQGTVEYVALILLLAAVFAAVVSVGKGQDFDIGTSIVKKLKDSIDGVGDAPKKGK